MPNRRQAVADNVRPARRGVDSAGLISGNATGPLGGIRNLLTRNLTLLFAFLVLLWPPSGITSPQTESDSEWKTERTQYQEALALIAKGKITQANRLKSRLKDYPLYPYLEYAQLRQQMRRRTPSDAVSDFLERYQDTPLAPQLKHHWLRTLARRGQWQRYLSFYDDGIRATELKCYALWAQYKTTADPDSILDQVQKLWLVGKSQPQACDPIFKAWSDSGRLTDELAWQRFAKAMQAGNTGLARYLIRYMSADQQSLARLYRELYFYPQRLQQQTFGKLDHKEEEILLHAVRRLAAKDASLAYSLWPKLSLKHGFSDTLTQQVNHRIIARLAAQDQELLYLSALASYPYPDDTELLEAGINMAIRGQHWQRVVTGIAALPEPTRELPHWQYWYARAAQHSPSVSPDTAVDSRAIYIQLAETRDYYGFLAADHLSSRYSLNGMSYPIEGNFLEQFKLDASVIRAWEFYQLGNRLDARREWAWASRAFTSDQHYTAAHYAHQLGWHSQAIRSAIQAEKWHDLKLRFPLSYQQEMADAARKYDLNVNWLLAVARQESAMTRDARSIKGAMGLMQVMPATAKMVSKRHAIDYRSSQELLTPKKNIDIAGAYLKDLLDQFEGNSIYATAAYNAGPHRVSRWLEQTADQPIDIWIENIPFSETRQYVKNVLAYSVIFAQLREDPAFKMATKTYLDESSPQLAVKEKSSNNCCATCKDTVCVNN